MPALVVVGAQWGDEGKGKIVHYLAGHAAAVARYQGGNNAGHTVVWKGKTFALHLIPSGILWPGKQNIIGNGVVLSPQAFRDEVAALKARGIRAEGRLHVSPLTHVIMPYHVILDTLREEGGRGIGTTRRGIGPCYEDKVARIGIRLCDFLEPATFKALVRQNLRVRRHELSKAEPLSRIEARAFKDYPALRRALAPFCSDTAVILEKLLAAGRRVLMESAQGVMLDLDFGTYPFVTSSNPVAGACCAGAGIGPTRISAVLGVAKAYTTRVGSGPFPTEMPGGVGDRLREAGGEYGTTTGRPRRIGWLDLVQLRLALRVNGVTALAMTKLDTLTGIHPIRACVGYRLGRKILTEFPPSRVAQNEVEPIYEDFQGFDEPLGQCRSWKNLPPAARRYVVEIERRLKVPITIVSVGQGHEQTIMRSTIRCW